MGINNKEMIFLRYAYKFGDFKRTITIGRQNLYASEAVLKKINPGCDHYAKEKYVENLLIHCFNSTVVDSIDKSDFEMATIIHDMNNPVPDELRGNYDTVIDSGTLEHIYNVPQALENISSLCSPGGQIIHMVPANNDCGHGFWQISPELFFSVYSFQNGYKNTEVWLTRPFGKLYNFYRVARPKNGERVMIYSKDAVYAYARTIRRDTKFFHKNVQQSDYIYKWDGYKEKEVGKHFPLEDFVRRHYLVYNLARKVMIMQRSYYLLRNSLYRFNPNLSKIDIKGEILLL